MSTFRISRGIMLKVGIKADNSLLKWTGEEVCLSNQKYFIIIDGCQNNKNAIGYRRASLFYEQNMGL